jgi:DNA-binding response OmpR family regulator
MAGIEGNASGAKVLVVEDEALIACDLQQILETHGYKVIGPAASLARAFDLIEQETPELALLDVNLGAADSFALADVLAARNCEIIFVTGHSRYWISAAHRHRTVVEKPFLPRDLIAKVEEGLEASSGAPRRRSA